MNVLIPMAGAGSRFVTEGYKVHKPIIPTTSLKIGKQIPMVAAAILDLPHHKEDKIILIDREFHKKDGNEELIKRFIPKAQFITIDHLTSGQATTCLLAKELINNEEELLIAGCDNGMIMNEAEFSKIKLEAECIVFTHRKHELILVKPEAYGWVVVDEQNNVTKISVKKTISSSPINDHAIVATFWFRHGDIFVKAAEDMIAANDRVNNEFYVDQLINYVVKAGVKTKVFEVEKYLCWGTPTDYEYYENTIKYWKEFLELEGKK